jgi:hypothetical protein
VSVLISGLLMLQSVVTQWPQCADRRPPVNGYDAALADTLAERFAPALSFAPGERFFPTIPFFTALDGDGAMGNPDSVDFQDEYEVAPYLRDSLDHPIDRLHVSWQALLDAYHPEPQDTSVAKADHHAMEYALKRVVALYRICSLAPEQNRTIVRYLKSDEQAFERFETARTLKSILGAEPAFDVIQYFLYYLADWGLQGHPNDIELVSVFFPSNVDHKNALDRFRIIVGSGHSPRTPNNVLVLSSYHRGEIQLEDSTYVMVELGGHSSAPDLRPIGKFTPGLDANWHAYNVWGTRDAQAASGVGFLGKYAQAMTFDRGWQSDGTLVFPPSYSSTQMEAAENAIQGPPDSTAKQAEVIKKPDKNPDQHQYRLLPMHLLFRLDTALAADTAVTLDTLARSNSLRQEISEAVDAIQDRLCPARSGADSACTGQDSITWRSKHFSELATGTQVRAIRAMLRWKQDMVIDVTYNRFEVRDQALPGLPRVVEELSRTDRETQPAGKQRPWEHESFMGKCAKGKECEGKADPSQVFKAHLFRPNTYTTGLDGGLRNLVIWGGTASPTDTYELYTGLVVPAFRSHGLPIRLGGFLELHAGVSCAWRCRAMSPMFGVLQEGNFSSQISWYVRGSWTPRRPEVVRRADASEFLVGGGVSLLPMISSNTFRVINIVRLRAGLRLEPFQGKDLLRRVRWEFTLAFRQ